MHESLKRTNQKEHRPKLKKTKNKLKRLNAKLTEIELIQISFKENALRKRQVFLWTKSMKQDKETNCCK